jgi:hypothetical protein
MKKANYSVKGVKNGGGASKCTSGTSNTKKGAYASSNGPSMSQSNGFTNNAGGKKA